MTNQIRKHSSVFERIENALAQDLCLNETLRLIGMKKLPSVVHGEQKVFIGEEIVFAGTEQQIWEWLRNGGEEYETNS